MTDEARGRSHPGLLHDLLLQRSTVVVCGPGGVGKTTTAASVAASVAASRPAKVLVLTIDPARRLADALGLADLGNSETRVPGELFAPSTDRPRGELWAAMLDTGQAWDHLVRAHAPDPASAAKLLANPLYRNISTRFVQSHDYIAAERLLELHDSGRFDLIVVDTPPSRHAVDFLLAPDRMADFFSSRLLRWLLVPYRSRWSAMASRPFTQIADRVLGTVLLKEVSEFFTLIQAMHSGFTERAKAVSGLLRDFSTTFMVVTTLEAGPRAEAAELMRVLCSMELELGAVVFNKVLPRSLLDPAQQPSAAAIESEAERLASDLSTSEGLDELLVARVLREVGASFLQYRQLALREERQAELLPIGDAVCSVVPYFGSDVTDLGGLLRLGEAMMSTTCGRSRGGHPAPAAAR